ncbi:cupin domain-containing protein [Agromyces laixinhei]|uniref:cupin domain-containing protein n=1 Tax=Agromyces laixinhei TaxID=2585717 RepID=UPI0012ED6446|nr:cupin domain-containing protein [Agromyces laixinhei]
MTSRPSAEDIRRRLQLEPNQTCGFVRVSYTSDLQLAAGALASPLGAHRPVGTGLLFMVTPAAPVRLHRILNDQLYHYYRGDPLELLLLHADGSSERATMGPDLEHGQHVQLTIPGGTFHTARVIGDREWFLGGSTEWPGVIPSDVELGDVDALSARHPDVAEDIRSFPLPVRTAGGHPRLRRG